MHEPRPGLARKYSSPSSHTTHTANPAPMVRVVVVCDEDLAESFLQVDPMSSQQISEEGGSRWSHDSCVHRKRLTPLGKSYDGVPGSGLLLHTTWYPLLLSLSPENVYWRAPPEMCSLRGVPSTASSAESVL